jgi:predicted nucleic acid-binding protein
MLVYLDSNILIYAIERSPNFGTRATTHIALLAASGDEFIVSDLTRLECRATPLVRGNRQILTAYDQFFQQRVHAVFQLTTSICDNATVIRGQYNFKTPDCLHLAAALEAGCGKFVTNDLRLNRFTGIAIELLP